MIYEFVKFITNNYLTLIACICQNDKLFPVQSYEILSLTGLRRKSSDYQYFYCIQAIDDAAIILKTQLTGWNARIAEGK